jgi:hypothetical protein
VSEEIIEIQTTDGTADGLLYRAGTAAAVPACSI